ncbi:MAG TPA: ABC transporter ATP-binding protein [Candidatus Scybalocola faecipullorum]|nr:ABC transporter ATP-binding protein [Candidatus Scybalocola faecipullorum]
MRKKRQKDADNYFESNAFLKNYVRNRGHNMKILLNLYHGNYYRLFISTIFFVIKNSPVWVVPIATANIVDAATSGGSDGLRVIIINMVVLGIMVAQNIPTNYVHAVFYSKAIRDVEANLRVSLVKKLQQLSLSYHNSTQSGRLQSKIMRDVEQIEVLSQQLFVTGLSIALNIAVALAVVISKSWVVFLFFICTIPIAVAIIVPFRGKIQNKNKVFRQEMEETSAKVMEMVELIPVTKAHGLEDREIRKMDKQLVKVAKKGYELDVFQSYFASISWVVFQLFQVICLGFSGYMAFRGQISVGDVVLYQSYFTSIISQISNIVTQVPIITKGLESVSSVGDVLLAPDIEDNFDKEKIGDVAGDLKFKDVSFSYDNNHDVLKELNLHIHPGETVAFVGGSGAGKTTLLNLLIGFLKPTSGSIEIDGKNLNDIDLRSYRSHISVVPQNTILFTGTIRENICYGMNDVSDEELRRCIAAANLTDMIDQMDDGIETMINEHGSNLSGGQRQRISIARALIRNPEIIILDEATSALDPISEGKIQKSLAVLAKGRTTLIVAHRLSTIKNADKIVVIEHGRAAESGTYDELMALKGRFYELHATSA